MKGTQVVDCCFGFKPAEAHKSPHGPVFNAPDTSKPVIMDVNKLITLSEFGGKSSGVQSSAAISVARRVCCPDHLRIFALQLLVAHFFLDAQTFRIVLSVSTQSSHETNEVEGIEGV